jgi:hypothetical protein
MGGQYRSRQQRPRPSQEAGQKQRKNDRAYRGAGRPKLPCELNQILHGSPRYIFRTAVLGECIKHPFNDLSDSQADDQADNLEDSPQGGIARYLFRFRLLAHGFDLTTLRFFILIVYQSSFNLQASAPGHCNDSMKYRSMSRLTPFAFALAAILAGCAGGAVLTKVDDGEIGKLKAENNAIILLYTSLNDIEGAQVMVKFARPNEKGRYIGWRSFQIKEHGGASATPGQLKIPAGNYAIVELSSALITASFPLLQGEGNVYQSQDAKADWASGHMAWDRALATFKVEAGEVVDIGHIHVRARQTERTPSGQRRGLFTVKVGPMPEHALKNLAERNPDLARARIVRTMVAPAYTQ